MAAPAKRLPAALMLLVAGLAALQAYRSVHWLVFYADHGSPVFAAANWVAAVASGGVATAIFSGFFKSADRPSGVVGRFFDMGSGLWPTVFGLVILSAGLYGLLMVANYVDDNYDWLFYAAEGGVGLLILKRTFTMND